jgi:uncharacterized protein YqcC (DUF446 family)
MTDTGNQNQIRQLADGLLQTEIELRQLDLWAVQAPPEEAFQSTEPFHIDTLTFPQWLQFVFIERMKVIIEKDQPLPAVSGIAPMAEEYFRGQQLPSQGLVSELERIDQLLSGG